MGAYAWLEGGTLRACGMLAQDAGTLARAEVEGQAAGAEALGARLADEVVRQTDGAR